MDGTYKVYAVDAAGNLSSASSNSVTLLIDYALDFDGTNDSVSANGAAATLNNPDSTSSLPLSVSAWVYPENGTKSQFIFGLYKDSPFINGPSVWFGENDNRFNYYDKDTPSTFSSNTYSINNWHHVVLTIGNNGAGVLYVNGSSALTISAANGEGGLDMFIIGVDYDNDDGSAGSPAQYFDGKIDEVAVWNDELTSAEVTAIYNSGNMLNVSSDSGNYESAANLQGYYRFNEGSGTELQDNSPNSNTGTINGAIWTAGSTASTANFTAATDDVGTVTGALTSGNTTDDTALVLSGTNESGSSVKVFNGSTELGAATVSGTSWSYSATVANGTTYQFNVRETNLAGNTSAATSNFAVTGDTTAPTVSSIVISSATGSQNSFLNAGDVVSVTATFSENVPVTGTPQLTLVVGGTNRTATYTSGSGSTPLVFQYTIQAGETDSDGISIGAAALAFHNGRAHV